MLRIALGGALGTALRLLVGMVVGGGTIGGGIALAADPPGAPALLLINTVGAAALGVVAARPSRLARWLPAAWLPALTTGLLGGFTTFSTLVVQAGTLGHDAGLVAADSARMTGMGLLLVAAFLAGSVGLGLAAYVIARRVASR